ncbi:hypothetical protein DL98DRAFT_561017, partial [Cadophora sp. DSE1049]
TQQLNSPQPPHPPSPSPSPSPSPPPQYLPTPLLRLFGPLGQCISPFREGNCSGLLDCPLLNKNHTPLTSKPKSPTPPRQHTRPIQFDRPVPETSKETLFSLVWSSTSPYSPCRLNSSTYTTPVRLN